MNVEIYSSVVASGSPAAAESLEDRLKGVSSSIGIEIREYMANPIEEAPMTAAVTYFFLDGLPKSLNGQNAMTARMHRTTFLANDWK